MFFITAIIEMADLEHINIEKLSDEEKAVAIQRLVQSITELTRQSQDAAANLGKLSHEESELSKANGMFGLIATSLKRSAANKQQGELDGLVRMLNSAKQKSVGLYVSRITAFRARQGESLRDTQARFGSLYGTSLSSVNNAERQGTISSAQANSLRRVMSEKLNRFRTNPASKEFAFDYQRLARTNVNEWFKGRTSTMMRSMGIVFNKLSPVANSFKPFFTASGFSMSAGLGSLAKIAGPWGVAISGLVKAIGLLNQYTRFQGRTFKESQGVVNKSLEKGMDTGESRAYNALMTQYGAEGDASLANLFGGFSKDIGSLGKPGGNIDTYKRFAQLGIDVGGSGKGGFATPKEMMSRVADFLAAKKSSGELDKNAIPYYASQMGISGAAIRALSGGAKKFNAELGEFRDVADLMDSEKYIEKAKAHGKAAAQYDIMKQYTSQIATANSVGKNWIEFKSDLLKELVGMNSNSAGAKLTANVIKNPPGPRYTQPDVTDFYMKLGAKVASWFSGKSTPATDVGGTQENPVIPASIDADTKVNAKAQVEGKGDTTIVVEKAIIETNNVDGLKDGLANIARSVSKERMAAADNRDTGRSR